jgi:hypothetical protein
MDDDRDFLFVPPFFRRANGGAKQAHFVVAHFQVVPLLQQRFSSGQNEPLKKHFAAAMQSWRERCEKCVCLQGDYDEK